MQRAASVARQALDAGIKAKVDHSFLFLPQVPEPAFKPKQTVSL